MVGSVCTCELLMGTSARYGCSQEHDHECKPSPHRHTSASTSGEKAEQAARPDCCGAGDRPSCARSQVAANLFTIPYDDEREAASSARLACWRTPWDSRAKQSMSPVRGTRKLLATDRRAWQPRGRCAPAPGGEVVRSVCERSTGLCERGPPARWDLRLLCACPAPCPASARR